MFYALAPFTWASCDSTLDLSKNLNNNAEKNMSFNIKESCL